MKQVVCRTRHGQLSEKQSRPAVCRQNLLVGTEKTSHSDVERIEGVKRFKVACSQQTILSICSLMCTDVQQTYNS